MTRAIKAFFLGICILLLASIACDIQLFDEPTPLPAIVPSPASTPAIPVSPNPQEKTPTSLPTLPAPSAPPSTPAFRSYAVIMVSQGDVLNIRELAGTSNPVVDALPAQATGVQLTGKESLVDQERWVEVQRLSGGTGWVNAAYLTEYKPPAQFCADNRALALIENLKTSFETTNPSLLSSLVSPLHGVFIEYLRDGTMVHYTPEQAKWIFTGTEVVIWGNHPASGREVKASFRDEVLPKLVDVLESGYSAECNSLQGIHASYAFTWPYEFANLNFYAVTRSGTPGNELDWRTWLAGIEYVDGKPYLFTLIHLTWEP